MRELMLAGLLVACGRDPSPIEPLPDPVCAPPEHVVVARRPDQVVLPDVSAARWVPVPEALYRSCVETVDDAGTFMCCGNHFRIADGGLVRRDACVEVRFPDARSPDGAYRVERVDDTVTVWRDADRTRMLSFPVE